MNGEPTETSIREKGLGADDRACAPRQDLWFPGCTGDSLQEWTAQQGTSSTADPGGEYFPGGSAGVQSLPQRWQFDERSFSLGLILGAVIAAISLIIGWML